MVNRKTASIAIISMVLTGLTTGCSTQPQDRFQDVRTGKTYQDTTALLTERKTENANEFRVVTELANEDKTALDAYSKAFEVEGKISKPTKTLFFNENGQEINKEEFIEKLIEKKTNKDFEKIVKNYYQFLSESNFKEALGLINPNSPFSKTFFGDYEIFRTQNESVRNTSRYVEAYLTDFKLIFQSYKEYTIEAYFKVLGFYRNPPVTSPDDQKPSEENNAKIEEIRKNPKKLFENDVKIPEWNFRYSGVSKFTLIFKDGKWLIHD